MMCTGNFPSYFNRARSWPVFFAGADHSIGGSDVALPPSDFTPVGVLTKKMLKKGCFTGFFDAKKKFGF